MESFDLAGVIVGETRISHVDGEAGRLSYRGQKIEALVDRPVSQVIWLLVFGAIPSAEQEAALRRLQQAGSRLNDNELAMLQALPHALHPMLMLQSLVPGLSIQIPEERWGFAASVDEDALIGLFIAAKLPALIAAWYRLRADNSPVPAAAELALHEDFLVRFHGQAPQAWQLSLLDAAQILQMEHGFNASTFAGRVCASTQAPIQSSLAASIGTLFGVLHGGADQAALEMAQRIGSAERAADWVATALANKQKIMGMGHREYRVIDPRALLLKPLARKHCVAGEAKNLLEVLLAVEASCQQHFAAQGKAIHANVEFYKGAVFHSLGIPAEFFTALFAMARVYGYVAHYLEFKENRRLIRPQARYIGD